MHTTQQMNDMKVTIAVYAHLATKIHCYRISLAWGVCSLKMWQGHGCPIFEVIICTSKQVCFLPTPTEPPQGTRPDVLENERTQQQITHRRRKPETPNGVKTKWQEDTGSRRRIEDRQIAVTPKEKKN